MTTPPHFPTSPTSPTLRLPPSPKADPPSSITAASVFTRSTKTPFCAAVGGGKFTENEPPVLRTSAESKNREEEEITRPTVKNRKKSSRYSRPSTPRTVKTGKNSSRKRRFLLFETPGLGKPSLGALLRGLMQFYPAALCGYPLNGIASLRISACRLFEGRPARETNPQMGGIRFWYNVTCQQKE